MKKIIPIFILLIAFSAAVFAKKPKPVAESDSYDENEEVTTIKVEKNEANSNASSDPYSKSKMKPKNDRSFGEKMFGLNKFQDIEAFSVYVRSPVGKLHLKRASLIHRAGTDIGGFFCYYDTSCYAVQFAESARNGIINAINQYFDDFDNRKLDKKAKLKKTEAVYGIVEGYEEYGVAKAMLRNYARPKMALGYAFIDGNPYFMIYAKKADNLAHKKTSSDDPNMQYTIIQRYYFTKAQAKTLATFLSNENIDALYASTTYTEVKEGDFDQYDDSFYQDESDAAEKTPNAQ